MIQGKDSAYFYFNKATSTTKDSLPVATAYYNMAVIQSDAGDYFGAQESLTLSLRYLNESTPGDRVCLADDYNELGRNNSKLKNHTAAIGDYNKALQFTNDSTFIAIIRNNKAQAYQENKDYPNALKLYERILARSRTKDSDYARTLTNLTITKWLMNPAYNAAPQLLTALYIRRRAGDLWGQNSSYDHLADYYMRDHIDSALFYSRSMYTTAISLNSPDDQLLALEKLIKVGPVGDTKKYFSRYQKLNDSVQTARSAAKNQFALIRYNVEKNKSDNLILQKDNADKKYQLNRQRIITAFIIVIGIMAIVGIIYWLRKRRQQAVRENQLRMSTRVHNRVANSLYQLIQEIDNGILFEQERVVRQLNVLYERSRDISHEQPQQEEGDFTEQIRQLLGAFAGSGTNMAIFGNNADSWLNIDAAVKVELE
ncbi:MAG: histidine kinase, partial [Mucilaginibacter sp.]|nr:histidine kinase [Mucilaginibacter sp.]